MMPMRTVYGEASIIARAAIDASRAAIRFLRRPKRMWFDSLVAQHAQRVWFLHASGQKSSSLLVPYKTLARALEQPWAKTARRGFCAHLRFIN